MTNKITRTMRALWSTKKGKAAIFLAGFLVVAVAVVGVGGALVGSRTAPTTRAATHAPGHSANPADAGTGSSDLFATTAPSRTGSPQPSADGTVDIGGPGIPANTNSLVNPDAPETTADPSTGLAAFPAPVPHSRLTVPLEQRWTVQQCASSRVPQARAYANQLIGYLFTFDASRASWSDFATPLHDTWYETVGGYGNGPDQKETPGSSWENRISSLGYSEQQWQQWANRGMHSEVRINAVTTTAGSGARPATTSYETRLTYDVTITRSAPGIEPQSEQQTIFVVVVAPCSAEYVVPPVFRDKLTSLQMGDFGRVGDGLQ